MKTTFVEMKMSDMTKHVDDMLIGFEQKGLTPHEAYAIISVAKTAIEELLGITDSGVVGHKETP